MADDDDFIGDLPEATSRRGFLLAGGGVAAAGLIGWAVFRAPGETGGGAADDAPPRTGGHFVFAFDGTAQSKFALDPHHSGFAPHNRITRAIYDNLTVLNADGSVGPWLAESWDVSPDQTLYTFRLRRGVTFHDGTPFDAAALKANFDRLVNPAKPLYSRNSIGPYAGSQVTDSHTLEVRLSEPFAPLLRNLSSTKLGIVSPAAVAKHGAVFAQNPVGTGPFRFVGATPGTEVRLARHPDYRWAPAAAANQGPAHLDTLTFRNVPEEATRVAVLQSGQAHASDLVPPQNLGSFRDDPGFRLLEKELLESNYALTPNVAKAPWGDDEIRTALQLSLDLDAIVKTVYLGTLARAWAPLSPSMFGSADTQLAGSWKPDPARAAAILEAKGWKRGADGIREKDGRRLQIVFVDSQGNREKRMDVVQLVRRQLAATGIDLKVDNQPGGNYLARIGADEYDMTGGSSFHGDPDVLRASYVPEARSVLSANNVDDPELAGWLRAAAREGDPARRAALYRKAQARVVERAYSIPVYVLLYNLVAAQPARGVAIDAHGFPDFHGAWLA